MVFRTFFLLFPAFIFSIFSGASYTRADNWQAPIYEAGAPPRLVGVDKKNHIFKFFEKQSPFKLRFSYPCVTGQLQGDKKQINDLRTPEGIYFVEYKISGGLDFKEYGGVAYTLNYPNPVDRLRGKTGHGIWIHSKGFDLVPTRGCVAIDLKNIAEVGPHLLPGTAVVLAEELSDISNSDNGTLSHLREQMRKWSQAWASKSPNMFDFYDPASYSRATENFDLFRQNKERLFKILSFIKIYNREIHALEGPGYWVTWAEQFYTASNLSTEGIRRLYWQKDNAGNFRIVGMEWTPRDVGMATALREGTLIAEAPAAVLTDAASEAPVAPRLDLPELAPEAAVKQSLPAPIKEIASVEPIKLPNENLQRATNSGTDKNELIWGAGKRFNDLSVTPPQEAPHPTPALKLPDTPMTPVKATPKPRNDEKEIIALVNDWITALEHRDSTIDRFYDATRYNRMPANSGAPRGHSLNAVLSETRRDFRQPWIAISHRMPKIKTSGALLHSSTDILIATPKGIRQGEQSHWWSKDINDNYKIISSTFKPADVGLQANYLEDVSGEIAATVEDWRKAWESGDIDSYMAFYAPNAMQQGRAGADNIRRQKEALWTKVKPSMVRLSGLRVLLDGSGARADMTQSYSDSKGHGDKGVKTLILRYDGRNWLIQREDWATTSAPSQKPSGQLYKLSQK